MTTLTTRWTLVAAAALLLVTGCHQSRYINLYAEDAVPDPARADLGEEVPDPGSQAFFLFGGVPAERAVDTTAICGEGRVQEIRTQRTFGQGFLRTITLGLYAPYTGQTVCTWHWR